VARSILIFAALAATVALFAVKLAPASLADAPPRRDDERERPLTDAEGRSGMRAES
jgi:hypothetical protein